MTSILRVSATGLTDPGSVRPNNQDSLLVTRFPSPDGEVEEDLLCMAVADGMGGHDKGELASYAAVTSVQRALSALVSSGTQPVADEALARLLVETAHRAVKSALGPGDVGGTTLTLALVQRGQCHVGHVGDSRCYVIHQGKLRRVTRDDTWAEHGGAAASPSALMQALGMGNGVRTSTATFPLAAGDRAVLCSDGLYRALSEETISQLMRRPGPVADWCERLVKSAIESGAQDNVTVCALETSVPSATPSRWRFRLRTPLIAVALVLAVLGAVAYSSFYGHHQQRSRSTAQGGEP